MQLKKLTTNMMVEDVGRTVAFYRDILGFEFVMAVAENGREVLTALREDQALDYAMMKNGDVEVMFQARRSLIEDIPELDGIKIGGSLTFYIEVDDVTELYTELRNRVTIVKELKTTFYGMQEFYIRDCNGYILAFAQPGGSD